MSAVNSSIGRVLRTLTPTLRKLRSVRPIVDMVTDRVVSVNDQVKLEVERSKGRYGLSGG